MTRGKLLRWRVVEGAELPENGMDPICDVAPTGLTDDPEIEASAPVLEIESHEEGYLARILLAEGAEAAPDEAIAVICEREEDVPSVHAAYEVADGRSLSVEPATFAWQAYLAPGHAAQQCSNS